MATKKKNEGIVVKHDFEKAKKELQKFSKETTTPKELSKVDTNGGLFGWFSHKVTGSELNILTSEIQEYLIGFNKLHVKIIKEFGQVYTAFESLDRDYIKAIQVNMDAILKTNMELKDAQADIKDVIAVQKKTLDVLKKFKEKLEKYQHLEDIDKLWKNQQTLEEKFKNHQKDTKETELFLKSLKTSKHLTDVDELWETSKKFDKSLKMVLTSITSIEELVKNQNSTLMEISAFNEKLQGYVHLDSIDELWEDHQKRSKILEEIKKFVQKLQKIEHITDIDILWGKIGAFANQLADFEKKENELSEAVNEHSLSLEELKTFKEKLCEYEHLFDVDEIWDLCNSLNTKMIEQLSEIEELKNVNKSLSEELKTQITELRKKLNISYVIAGGTGALIVIELILHFLGVI